MVEPGAKFAPFAGAVRLTLGSVLTRIVLAADVAVAPVLSVAFEVRL
jgi:hypothetical protein